MWICELNTTRFNFKVLAEGRDGAVELMKTAIRRHCRQYGASPKDFFAYFPEHEWTLLEFNVGDCYRDNMPI